MQGTDEYSSNACVESKARSGGRRPTTKDDGEPLSDGMTQIIERERLQYAARVCPPRLLADRREMYDDEEVIDARDVAYVVRGLVSEYRECT